MQGKKIRWLTMNKIMLVALLGGFLILGALSLTFLIDHRLNLSVSKLIEETREYVYKAFLMVRVQILGR